MPVYWWLYSYPMPFGTQGGVECASRVGVAVSVALQLPCPRLKTPGLNKADSMYLRSRLVLLPVLHIGAAYRTLDIAKRT